MSSEWKDRECEVKDNSPWDLIQDRGGKNSQKSMCREVLTLNGKLRVLQPYQVFGVATGHHTIILFFFSLSPYFLSVPNELTTDIHCATKAHIFFSTFPKSVRTFSQKSQEDKTFSGGFITPDFVLSPMAPSQSYTILVLLLIISHSSPFVLNPIITSRSVSIVHRRSASPLLDADKVGSIVNKINNGWDSLASSVEPAKQSLGKLSEIDVPQAFADLVHQNLQNHNLNSLVEKVSSIDAANVVAVSFGVVISQLMINLIRNKPYTSPYPFSSYDPVAAAVYFSTRPFLQIYRSLEIALTSASFVAKIIDDTFISKPQSTFDFDKFRGEQLAALLTRLGPSFIKVGQSLSTRSDLLSSGYCAGLTSLQDAVEPFSTDEAFRQVARSLNVDSVEDIFSEISPVPVASASLGQVYKATVRSSGEVVALKVQRSDVVKVIALDMHLIRSISPILQKLANLNTDLVDTVDTWAVGFVDETDYLKEAANAINFNENIQNTPLGNVVFAPDVISSLSTRDVLTTSWVEGMRLDTYDGEDVSKFVSIAMNCYLSMLLDGGTLHCDPHPGNLLVVDDNKLCILDWGLVSKIEKGLQITLIEHVAHLVGQEYDKVPLDLVKLNFVPANMVERMESEGVVELLTEIYSTWGAGGGAANIDINQVITRVRGLSERGEGSVFTVPPYFLLIGKAFSVLEGIGLSNDRDYSIINECLPYISKRLLSARDEKMDGALNSFIFGAERDSENRVIDVARFQKLASGFGSYSKSAANPFRPKNEIINEQADAIADLLLSEDNKNPFTDIVLEQGAKFAGANIRKQYLDLRRRSGIIDQDGDRSLAGFLIDPLGLWRESALVKLDNLDEKVLKSQKGLVEMVGKLAPQDLTQEDQLAIARRILEKAVSRRSVVRKRTQQFATYFVKQTSERLKRGSRGGDMEDIDSQLDNLEMDLEDDLEKTQSHKSSLKGVAAHEVAEVVEQMGEESDRLKVARAKLMQYTD